MSITNQNSQTWVSASYTGKHQQSTLLEQKWSVIAFIG